MSMILRAVVALGSTVLLSCGTTTAWARETSASDAIDDDKASSRTEWHTDDNTGLSSFTAAVLGLLVGSSAILVYSNMLTRSIRRDGRRRRSVSDGESAPSMPAVKHPRTRSESRCAVRYAFYRNAVKSVEDVMRGMGAESLGVVDHRDAHAAQKEIPNVRDGESALFVTFVPVSDRIPGMEVLLSYATAALAATGNHVFCLLMLHGSRAGQTAPAAMCELCVVGGQCVPVLSHSLRTVVPRSGYGHPQMILKDEAALTGNIRDIQSMITDE